MQKAFVLLSGGIDSSTCLHLANRDFESVTAISIDYGQRHYKEIMAACEVAETLGCSHETLTLAQQPRSMLTDPDSKIPDASYDDLGYGKSPTYHPFRNGQLLSYITSYAIAHLSEADKGGVYFGAHAEDAHNFAYADCTPEFIGAMANAIYIGTYHKVRLHTPLMSLMKAEIVTLGARLGVPFELTWSCYAGGELHCGTCPTCRARRDAFNQAHTEDPTEYAA